MDSHVPLEDSLTGAPSVSNPLPKDIQPAFPREVPLGEVRKKLLELLGLDDLPKVVDFTIEDVQKNDEVASTRVSYTNSLAETLSAVIIAPQSHSRKLPGVVCMHGTSGRIEKVIADELRLEEPGGQLLGWGRELARRGYATISISLKGSDVRNKTPGSWEEEAKLLEAYGRPHMGIIVEEALRAARVLAAQDSVNEGRIGLTGMSLGGYGTWYPMACEPWIAAGAAVCGSVGSLAKVIHEGDVKRHSSTIFVPHLLRHFDHADIVSTCIAPRPFMVVAPTEDEDMPRSGVDGLIPAVSEAYADAGRSDHFRVYQPPGRHVFQVQYFEWVVDWFDTFLEPGES